MVQLFGDFNFLSFCFSLFFTCTRFFPSQWIHICTHIYKNIPFFFFFFTSRNHQLLSCSSFFHVTYHISQSSFMAVNVDLHYNFPWLPCSMIVPYPINQSIIFWRDLTFKNCWSWHICSYIFCSSGFFSEILEVELLDKRMWIFYVRIFVKNL